MKTKNSTQKTLMKVLTSDELFKIRGGEGEEDADKKTRINVKVQLLAKVS